MSFTAERSYDVDGGVLKVSLKTDHALSDREYQALDRVSESYLDCFERLSRAARDRNQMDLRDQDEDEIFDLENICAG
jgi:hypothetical protein